MGHEGEMREAMRWVAQAKDDLSAAQVLTDNSKFAQACFLCQQAGEKAAKAVWFFLGEDPWGHSIARLIDDLKDEVIRKQMQKLTSEAMLLDRLYIPTRYPNGLPEITPMKAYERRDAMAASEAAVALVRVAEQIIER